MAQTTPATAQLGPGKTGLAIGLRVLNLDGTTYAAFSTTGVAETSVLGTYRKAGGVVVPDAGGYVVWGVSGTDYAEATVEPAWATQASVDDLPTNAELATALAGADDAVLAAVAALNDLDAAAVLAAMNAAPPSVNVTLWAGDAVAGAPALEATAQAILEDTGTTLPAVIAAVDSDVWSYATRTLTQSSTSTTDSTAAGSIARRRGDSWSISLTIGAITGYTSLWFTAKWDRDNTDAQSVLQIKLNASGLNDGLLYVNGAAATDDTLGSITVSDASTGAIVIAVDETITDDLPPAGIYYDVQALVSGTVSTLDSGTLTITADVTRAVA